MATNTPNINLNKPSLNDFFNIDDFNQNADIIDEEITKTNTKVSDIEQKVYTKTQIDKFLSDLEKSNYWKESVDTFDNIAKSVPPVAYQNEIVSPSENTTYDAKIGLMYASDYGFAASPSAWTTTLLNYNGNDAKGTSIKTINWMYMGYYHWMISRGSDHSDYAFFVYCFGYVFSNIVRYNFGVRPSFNLSSSITYVSGSGSAVDPIRVN